jgi:SAM-dependent methyltransferase
MAADDFLRAFHQRHPGVTTRAYARGRAPDGRSSYEILRDAVPAAARVLDLGCGDGFLLELLAPRAAALIGVDLSAAELALARARPALAAAHLVEASADRLPLADSSVDACVSHLAFTLMSAPDAVAREVARVLVPGGLLATIVGGGPAADHSAAAPEAFDAFLALAAPRLGGTPRLGDPRARHRAGLDAILGPAGFGPVAYQRVVIDLGGRVDEVWATLSTLYELAPLAAPALAALRADFERLAASLAVGGRVPCAMAVGVVTTVRR